MSLKLTMKNRLDDGFSYISELLAATRYGTQRSTAPTVTTDEYEVRFLTSYKCAANK